MLMKRTLFVLCLALPAVLAVGCMTTKVIDTSTQPGAVVELQAVHYMGGLGEPVVKADCANGVHSIAQGKTFGNAVLSSLTLGIYTPQTVRVTCAR
jgi:Bor protein